MRGLSLATLLALVLGACSADHSARRGQVALDAHDLSESERHFRRALELDPVHTAALEGLGWTYSLAGEKGLAASSFARCVELAPENTGCLRGQASAALAMGELPKARRLLDKALRTAPDDPEVLASQALVDLLTGDLDLASERYGTLVARYPERSELLVGLAEVRLRQGRAEEALPLIERGLADKELAARHRARLYLLHARALISVSAGREDPARCAETVPPLFAWLEMAGADLDQAAATGADLPDLPAVRRLLLRRRGIIEDACPQGGK